MPKHKWKFKSHFRRGAYGWKGTSLASKRMREAVSEIKKVAKKDSALAGEGVIELFYRLYPDDVEKVAEAGGRQAEFRGQLGREILKKSCKPNLREVVVKRLGQG